MTAPKVLVFLPYHPDKEYCAGLFMPTLHGIYKQTKTASVEIDVRFSPYGHYGVMQAVKQQREWAREQMLRGGFTHLLMFGADMTIAPDVLDRLLAWDKAIVGGVYCLRPINDQRTVHGAIAWMEGKTPEAKDAVLFDTAPRLVEVLGMGLDCVLIRRDVLEKISWKDWAVNDDDWPFYDRARLEGRKVFLDPSIQCGHWETADRYSICGKVARRGDGTVYFR